MRIGGMRAVPQGDFQHLLRRGHFQVERQARGAVDAGQVLVANVAAVFTQVNGDPVAPAGCHDLGRADWIGMGATARVADGRNVIDVHAKAQGVQHHGFARLPGLIAGVAASSGGSSSGA